MENPNRLNAKTSKQETCEESAMLNLTPKEMRIWYVQAKDKWRIWMLGNGDTCTLKNNEYSNLRNKYS